jgi:RNA polymerase sigma-70 factor, ECF subfamily
MRQRCGDNADIEDLLQESFLAAWQKIERYDERWSFSTWLFTIAHRRVISQWRRRKMRTVGQEELDLHTGGGDPAEVIERREGRDNLWTLAREVLPPAQRAALWLAYSEELDNGEIGRILGRSRPSVRVILFRARRTLERHLRARYAPSPEIDDPPSAVLLRGEL